MKRFTRKGWKQVCAAFLAGVILAVLPAGTVEAVSANGSLSKGIDVSMHNGTVDWNQVAASGIKFTFIKVGSTKSGVDPQFVNNITNAQAAGLKTGVYLYSYAVTPEQAAAEASLVLQWIDGYTVNYPVVFDIEDKCHKNLSNQQLLDMVNVFCAIIDAAGYYPMVYSNKNMFVQKLGAVAWDKWVAQYNDTCEYNNNVCFWQHTSSGQVKGVGTRVDLNYQYKNYDNLIIKDGFIAHNGNVRYYSNWRMQRGWIACNDTKYYLDEAGNLVRGWFADATGVYYLSPTDGSISRGQCTIDGVDFCFTPDGAMMLGWVNMNNARYYYDPLSNGAMKRGWLLDEAGNVYFLDTRDGHMLTGEQTVEGGKYLFGADGVMVRGMTPKEDGMYYYDAVTGRLTTGWIQLPDKICFADEKGRIVTGLYQVDGNLYYFNETGALVVNQVLELKGTVYQAALDGVLTQVPLPAETAPGEAPAAQS